MDWTDLQITVPAKDIDTAAAIAQMVVPYGIYIEDYSDMLAEVPKIAHIDLIDEELLAKSRDTAVIHIYISPEQSPAAPDGDLHRAAVVLLHGEGHKRGGVVPEILFQLGNFLFRVSLDRVIEGDFFASVSVLHRDRSFRVKEDVAAPFV